VSTYWEAVTSRADPAPVLNLLITATNNGKKKVLVAVRRRATNERHPGVISLPTMRIPSEFAAILAEQAALDSESQFPVYVPAEPVPVGHTGRKPPVVFLAESLLCRKLGVADLLEYGRLTGRCSLRLVTQRDVEDPNGTSITEPTRMFTVVVDLDGEDISFPVETASYSEIHWVEPDLLVASWYARDGQMLLPDANPFEICIRGLCVQSGVELIQRGVLV
jgi:hypothetical protein